MHHREKCLLEGILDHFRFRKHCAKAFFDLLGRRQRVIHRAADAYRLAADASDRIGIRQQVVCQERVQIADRVAVEADLIRLLRQHFDGRLVIQNHLRLRRAFALNAHTNLQ